jgi:hypothetical protein
LLRRHGMEARIKSGHDDIWQGVAVLFLHGIIRRI